MPKAKYRMAYREHDPRTESARAMVPYILDLTGPGSVVDIGCNRGHWLAVFQESGVEDICGVDGPWVDLTKLLFPRESFGEADLSVTCPKERRYDLAISLEVAEHLKPDRAESFVRDLTALSDVVVFAAAVPGQGGQGHVNEQWPDYWADLFEAQGYVCVDCLRKPFWNDARVFFFYAQNTFVYCKQEQLASFPKLAEHHASGVDRMPLSVVHPGLYARKMQKFTDRTFPGILTRGIRNRLRKTPGQDRCDELGLPPSAQIRI